MKWFKNPQTLEELKKQYKALAMLHHPDCGGNTADMQEINNEYDLLFARLKNVHSNAEGKTYTSTQNTTETPEQFRHIIEQLINLVGIEIELCGSWVWVTGDTKPHKDILKDCGFRWSRNKCAWYYHAEPYRKTSKKALSLSEIRDIYGSEKVSSEGYMQPVLQA